MSFFGRPRATECPANAWRMWGHAAHSCLVRRGCGGAFWGVADERFCRKTHWRKRTCHPNLCAARSGRHALLCCTGGAGQLLPAACSKEELAACAAQCGGRGELSRSLFFFWALHSGPARCFPTVCGDASCGPATHCNLPPPCGKCILPFLARDLAHGQGAAAVRLTRTTSCWCLHARGVGARHCGLCLPFPRSPVWVVCLLPAVFWEYVCCAPPSSY